MQNSEPRHQPYILDKNELKMDCELKLQMQNYKSILEGNTGGNIGDLGFVNEFLDTTLLV